ncbi:MAG: zeta toxin family protein [Actinobacteria bacterium]|nr:zeta toxin family protein [Actinomycetota bacterium]
MSLTEMRNEVAATLDVLSAAKGALHVEASSATWRLHALTGTDPYNIRYTPNRLRVHQRIVDRFLSSPDDIAEGSVVVATAGPPGAGKTARLADLGYGLGWRRIDSDTFKRLLIEHDLRTGDLVMPDEVKEFVLADGKGIMPLELASLYHYESTVIADMAKVACLTARENVIIEGTLSWDELPTQIVDDIVTHGYEKLDVVLVEAPRDVVLERALQRWWAGRRAGGIGGRFTPSATIRNLYTTSTSTVCGRNARDLVKKASAAQIAVELKK